MRHIHKTVLGCFTNVLHSFFNVFLKFLHDFSVKICVNLPRVDAKQRCHPALEVEPERDMSGFREKRRNFSRIQDLSRSKWHVDLIELNPDHAGIVVVEVSGSDFQPVKLPWFQGEGMKFADRIM